jgi:hypothetical protein
MQCVCPSVQCVECVYWTEPKATCRQCINPPIAYNMYTDLERILSACLYLCVSFYYGVVNFCRYVSVCLSVCLPACLSAYVSVCLPTCLFVCNRSYSWNHRYSCNCSHSCNRRYSCNCGHSCNCRYSCNQRLIEKPQLSCTTLLEKVALNYLFKTTHSPSTGEIQIYRKKPPPKDIKVTPAV